MTDADNAAPTPDLTDDEKHQQLRDMMSQYYGLENDDGTAALSNDSFAREAVVKPGDEHNLESLHFNPERYVSKLLKEKSLKGLMSLAAENTAKSKDLDKELQGLVYDNYNRFIAATETIRKMRDNVVRMDEKLHTLQSNVDAVDNLTQTLDGRLQAGRDNIEQKLAISRMMKQIQFLVELPARLRQCLKDGAYSVGANYWSVGDSVLHRHSNIASFRHIHEESRVVALQLQKYVLDRIRNTSMEGNQSLRETNELFQTLRELRQTSLSAGSSASDESKLLTDPIQSHFDADMKAFFEQIQSELSVRVATKPNGLTLTTTTETRQLVDALANSLLTFHTQMSRAGEMISRGGDEIPTQVRNTIRTMMARALGVFSTMTKQQTEFRLREGLVGGTTMSQPGLHMVCQEAVELLLFDLRCIMRPFREMAFTYLGPDEAKRFIHHLESTVHELLDGVLTLAVESYEQSSRPGVRTVPVHGLLLLSAFCSTVATYAIGELGMDSIDLSKFRPRFEDVSAGLAQKFVFAVGASITKELRAGVRAVAWKSVAENPDRCTVHMSKLTQELTKTETFIKSVIRAVAAQSTDTRLKSSTGSATGRLSSRRSQDSHTSGPSVSSRSQQAQPTFLRSDTSSLATMDRIFHGGGSHATSGYNARVNMTDPGTVLDAILHYVLKSFAESVRGCVLGKGGFHQMQVDCGYFGEVSKRRQWLRNQALQDAASEVLKSSYDRCVERSPLPQEAINGIVSALVDKMNNIE
eukprot:PhM_4_TR17426/c0_g2_i1/m.77934/K20296/ANG2, VPS51; vacuolar protein sorting-associated protein 51